MENCRVSLAVMKDARLLFSLSTDFVDRRALRLTGRGSVDFVVPDLPLSMGAYTVTSFLSSSGDEVIQDWVDDAAILEVVDGDYFGTGRLYHPGFAGRSVLVRHSYRLRSEPSGRPVETGVLAAGG